MDRNLTFPESYSFTVTNRCNLRCKMCGQWSEEGYVRGKQRDLSQEMSLTDWMRLTDEIAEHGAKSVLLRGGETFMFPSIRELIEYIHGKGMFVSIDSNGTLLKDFAADLSRLGRIHVTVSVDGPEAVHDQVRGVPGTFQRLKEGLALLNELQAKGGQPVSRSICFTIMSENYETLPQMPDVARSLGIKSMNIVPYYYFPSAVGKHYEAEMREFFGCAAYSWEGFHREESGVDPEKFLAALRGFRANLGDVEEFPYMPLEEQQYVDWFRDAVTPVTRAGCANVERLIDIQPTGEANYCVDFPDFSFGNVREASIETLWNSAAAKKFREQRRKGPFAVCYRCGAKYMGEMP